MGHRGRLQEEPAIYRQASTEEQALLQEIRTAPGDDFPRLVYADWLEEKGDPRAALIRIQCELGQLPWNDPRRRALEAENFLLLRDHIADWVPEVQFPSSAIPGLPQFFQGGFLHQIRMSSSGFVRQAETLIEKHPDLHSLEIQVVGPLTEFGKRPELKQITHLTLGGKLDDDTIAQLLVSPYLEQLEHLSVAGTLLEDHGAKAIANSPQLSNLKSLDLSKCYGIDGAALKGIVTSPNLRKLEAISLRRADRSPLPISLKELRWLPRLKSLDLAGANLPDRELELLGSGGGPSLLRHLILDRNEFQTQLLSQTLSSVVLSKLETLSLANLSHFGWNGLWTSSVSNNLGNLRSLNLSGSRLETRDYQNLAAFPGLHRLERLSLSRMPNLFSLGNLLQQPFPNLRELELSVSSLGLQDVEMLVRNRSLEKLQKLDLSTIDLSGSRSTIAELVNSTALAQSLLELRLGNCGLTENQLGQLRDSTGLSALRRLVLSGNRITTEGAKLLSEWPNRELLEEINLSSCHLGYDGLRAFLSKQNPQYPQGWILTSNELGNQGADLLLKSRRAHFRLLRLKAGNGLTPVKCYQLEQHFGPDVIQ